jgi:hypothetical protein
MTGTLQGDWYKFIAISRSVILKMRNISHKNCRENQNTHFVLSNFFPKILPFGDNVGKNVVQPDRPQLTIWRMGFACRITKTADPHWEYVILISFLQQYWLSERASVLRYTNIPVLFSLLGTSGFELRNLDCDSCYKHTESPLFCCLWTWYVTSI